MKNQPSLVFILLLVLTFGGLLWSINANAQCQELVWQDEFNGSAVDQSKWVFDIGDGCPSLCGWGNAEEQYYRAENATINNGNLVITTNLEDFGGKP